MLDILFPRYMSCYSRSCDYHSQKMTQREGSKIKSEMAVRVCGVIIVVLGLINFFI